MTVALVDPAKFPARLFGNGVTTVFPFQYKILAKADLLVYVAGVLQVVDVNYTVAGFNSDAGGTVTFISGAPANAASVVIIRAISQKRTTDYQQLGDFLSTTVNPDFDNPVLQIQDLNEQVDRCLQSSVTDPLASTILDKTSFIGKYVAVDASGNVVPASGTGNDSALRTDLASTASSSFGAGLIGWLRNATGAVASTLYRWFDWQAPSVAEFMTEAQRADAKSGAATLDCSAAVQAAINYAIANNVNLKNPYKKVLLSSTVNIDRLVDGAAFDSYFTVHGGGFFVRTAIPMFGSSIAFTTAPVTQLVKFNQVNFEASGTGFNAYVLDDAKFLRTQFDGCDFVKIKCLYAPTVFTQSIYLFRCNVRRFTGIFFRSLAVSFDIKFHGCIVEAADQFARLAFPVGCSIQQNLIEGCSGTAIKAWGINGLDVSGNYFEQNDCDLDFRPSAAESSYGVTVNGNNFNHTPGGSYAPSSTYSIRWGNTFSCVSNGNYFSTYGHELNAGAQVKINDFAVTAVSNSPGIQFTAPYEAPAFSARNSVAQSITTTTFTKVTLGTEEFDTNANFASSRFTPTVAGYYGGSAVVKVAGTNISRFAIAVYKNGTEFARLYDVPLPNVASNMVNVSFPEITMNGTTDYLELWVFVIATTPTVEYSASSDCTRWSGKYLRNNA